MITKEIAAYNIQTYRTRGLIVTQTIELSASLETIIKALGTGKNDKALSCHLRPEGVIDIYGRCHGSEPSTSIAVVGRIIEGTKIGKLQGTLFLQTLKHPDIPGYRPMVDLAKRLKPHFHSGIYFAGTSFD